MIISCLSVMTLSRRLTHRRRKISKMTWSYNPSNLGTDTATAERLNVVRYLVGDTDVDDQQVQDEEITFALSRGR
jgi:hypothetical protein